VQALSLDCVSAVSFYHELLFKTLAPLVVAAIVVAVCASMRRRADRWQLCSASLLILSFVVLPGVSVTIFRTFSCDYFDDGSAYLQVDYGVSCDTTRYRLFKGYAVLAVLLYPIGDALGLREGMQSHTCSKHVRSM
jgi:hypothetical protein